MGTVTQEEKEKFTEIKERLRVQLEYQLTNFRFCFPFGRPEGALKSTLTLLERVNRHSTLSSFVPSYIDYFITLLGLINVVISHEPYLRFTKEPFKYYITLLYRNIDSLLTMAGTDEGHIYPGPAQ